MLKLDLDNALVLRSREAAARITGAFAWLFDGYSTVAIERTVLRLMGIDGATKDGKPLPNVVVDHLVRHSGINRGAAVWVVNAMLAKNLNAQQVAEQVAQRKLKLTELPLAAPEKLLKVMQPITKNTLKRIKANRQLRDKKFAEYGPRRVPAIYVIVATGNIYEDVIQARAAAREGADIIADPFHSAIAFGLRSLWRNHCGLWRDLCHPGKLPHHACCIGRSIGRRKALYKPYQLCQRSLHAGNRCLGRLGKARSDAE